MISLKPPVLALACVAAVLGGCNDPGRLDPNDPQRQAKEGAVFGAIVGAGLGAALGGSNRGLAALGGAVAGGIVGATIGQGLDEQEAALRQQLAADGITITRTETAIIVSLRDDITFATGSFTVKDSLRPELAKLAQHLLRFPASNVQVIGHTDSDGDAAFNVGLSQRRANAVADVLQGNGVPHTRLAAIGRGEEQPIASNLTPEGRAQNRRVEILVIPSG